MAATLECYKHDYRADDYSHRPVENRQRPTSVLQQLEYHTAGHARAKIKQVIEELQDACAFAMMSRCSSAAARYEAQKTAGLRCRRRASRAVRILRAYMQSISDTRQPCLAPKLPCDAAGGHTNNVSEGFHLSAALLACADTE
jgi:hypothetical protein